MDDEMPKERGTSDADVAMGVKVPECTLELLLLRRRREVGEGVCDDGGEGM
jgi:hypothetical protein